MKVKAQITLAAILFLGLLETANAAGWYTGTVNRVQVKESGDVFVYVNGSTNNECGSTRVQMSSPSAVGSDRIFSHILANQAMGRKIQFYIASCNDGSGQFTKVEDLSP